jgi:hypothetical protein
MVGQPLGRRPVSHLHKTVIQHPGVNLRLRNVASNIPWPLK